MQREEAVVLSVEGTDIVVRHQGLRADRRARLYFDTVLGARPLSDGWACARRRSPVSDLVVRINTWLETHGWRVDRRGVADEAVERQLARRRSFERTRSRAAELREGLPVTDVAAAVQSLHRFGWNRAERPLLPHQVSGLAHGLTAINAANFSVPGSGKTATTLAIAAAHLEAGTVDVVVVVGPLSCFGPWESESKAALPGRLRVRRIRGNPTNRHAAYEGTERGDLLLVSYAAAAADQAALITLCRTRQVMLVIDESHRIKRFRGGLWAPALARIAEYARVRFILSGTPMPQSGRDLYSQLAVLWPGQELTGPRDTFGIDVERDFPRVLARLQPFLSRTPKDALGLPPYSIQRYEVPLTGTQADIYDLIESRFRRRLEDAATYRDKIDALRRGRPIRLLQAATNPDLLNKNDSQLRIPPIEAASPTLMERLQSYLGREVPAKTGRALELVRSITERRGKVVVWSNFVSNLDQFSAALRAAFAFPCYQIDGRMPVGDEARYDDPSASAADPKAGETRERIIESFLGVDGPAVLVATPASCSESISLHTTCHNAVYLDRTYDCALFLQTIARIHRLGLPADAEVTIHILIATVHGRMTIDGLVDQALQRKDQAMRRLLEGAAVVPMLLPDDPGVVADGEESDLAELLRFLLGDEPREQ